MKYNKYQYYRIYATKLELQILDNQIKAEWKGDGS